MPVDVSLDVDARIITLKIDGEVNYLTLEEACDLSSQLAVLAHVPKRGVDE